MLEFIMFISGMAVGTIGTTIIISLCMMVKESNKGEDNEL